MYSSMTASSSSHNQPAIVSIPCSTSGCGCKEAVRNPFSKSKGEGSPGAFRCVNCFHCHVASGSNSENPSSNAVDIKGPNRMFPARTEKSSGSNKPAQSGSKKKFRFFERDRSTQMLSSGRGFSEDVLGSSPGNAIVNLNLEDGSLAVDSTAGAGVTDNSGAAAASSGGSSTQKSLKKSFMQRFTTRKPFGSTGSATTPAESADDSTLSSEGDNRGGTWGGRQQQARGTLTAPSPSVETLADKRKSRDDSFVPPSPRRGPLPPIPKRPAPPKAVGREDMACPNCSKPLPFFARFCTDCGATVPATDSADDAVPAKDLPPIPTRGLPPVPSRSRTPHPKGPPPKRGGVPGPPKAAPKVRPVPPKLDQDSAHASVFFPSPTLAHAGSSSQSAGEMSRRERIVRELHETERTYINGLRSLVDAYVKPFREKFKTPLFTGTGLDQILPLNEKFLGELDARLATYNDETTKIADLFLSMGRYMKPVYSGYGDQYQSIQRSLVDAEKDTAVEEWLKTTQMEDIRCQNQSIRALLITPVQRIPRYSMLLEDLQRKTPAEHPDAANGGEAVDLMRSIASSVNESIRKGENVQKLLFISSRFIAVGKGTKRGEKFDVVAPHRELIRDGVMMKMCRKEAQKRWFFIFNDLLVYATIIPTPGAGEDAIPRFASAQQFDMNTVLLEDVPDTEIPFAFRIRTPRKSFVVICADMAEKVEWMLDITRCIDDNKAKRATFRVKTNVDDDDPFSVRHESVEANTAPVWVPDSEAPLCGLCSARFTPIRRRHHCRLCGKCICGSCSTHKILHPSFGVKKKRVCDGCFGSAAEEN